MKSKAPTETLYADLWGSSARSWHQHSRAQRQIASARVSDLKTISCYGRDSYDSTASLWSKIKLIISWMMKNMGYRKRDPHSTKDIFALSKTSERNDSSITTLEVNFIDSKIGDWINALQLQMQNSRQANTLSVWNAFNSRTYHVAFVNLERYGNIKIAV